MTEQTSTIPRGWKMTTLGEVISSGLVFNHNNKRYPLSGGERLKKQGIYPYYGAASAIDFIDEYKYDGYYLLVAEDGTVYDGKSPMLQLVNGKFWVSNHSHVLQGKDEVITRFLSYILKNVSVSPYITGAVQPKLTKENLYSISFLIPESNKEQRAIAAVLSSLDDKIELLREQNKTLEATAQAIFKEWFVNFNFPGTTGKMIDSELGKIPEGWRIGKLGEAIEIFDSKRVPLASGVRAKRKGKFPYYGATSIMDYIDGYLFDGTYLLLAEDGSVIDNKGCPVLQYVWGQFWVSNHAHVLQGKNGFSTEILYVFLKKANITGIVNGAVQLKINQTNLVNFEILIPPKGILGEFDSILQPIFSKIKNIEHQIQTLSALRDALLPKLMKGEVRVEGVGG